MMGIRAALCVSIAVFCSLAFAEDVVWEGFEGKNNWVMVEWRNSGRGRMEISKENPSEGAKSLKVRMNREKKTDREKVGISREGYLNLSRSDSITMDIFCGSDDGLAVSIGFDAGDKGAYYESVKKPLKMGWNKDIVFGLSGNNFKCEASDWKFEDPIPDRSSITKMHIVIYRPSNVISEETVFIDNIRIKQRDPV
ncbi:MAG: hypothetical protein WCY23_04995 [Candidatus Omnitrophota bacterium]